MKNKILNQYRIFNYIVSTDKFKILFLLTLIVSIYGAIVIPFLDTSYIDAVFMSYQFYFFNIFVFLVLFLNTLNTCTIFNKELSNYIIRLKSRKKYIIELLKTTFLLNLFFFILLLFLYFMLLNMTKISNIKIVNYQNYDISNLTYMIFYLFRYVVYALIITAITTIIYINFKEKITLVISTIFLIGLDKANSVLSLEVVNSLTINIWKYYSTVFYESFSMELKFSIIYFFILLMIVLFLYFLTLKNKRWEVT